MAKLGLLLVTFLITNNALAFQCSFGEAGQDNYIQITFNEDSAEVQLHETFFVLQEEDVDGDLWGNYMLIPRTSKTLTAEGEEFEAKVFGIMLFKGDKATLFLEIEDMVTVRNEVLTCD